MNSVDPLVQSALPSGRSGPLCAAVSAPANWERSQFPKNVVSGIWGACPAS